MEKNFQPPSYVNVSTAKITLPLAIQVIYELSLANDFHTGLYTVSSPLSLHTVKRKIHRINVLENIVVIKSVASSRAPPKKRSSYSLTSAQLTCSGERSVSIHHRPQHDNGHLFSEAAFRSCRLTGIPPLPLRLWLDLKPTQGAGSPTMTIKYGQKHNKTFIPA